MCDLPLQHYTQVNISEWCKGWKNRGHLHSPDFNIKWVLFPSFNPSLPISCLHTFPISPISVSVPPSASLNFSFCPRSYSVTPAVALVPVRRNLTFCTTIVQQYRSARWARRIILTDCGWTVYLQLQATQLTIGCSKLTSSYHCTFEYSGRLPVAFLTILNPFHSIWEMLAVVSRSLSPHTTATATPQKRKIPYSF